MKRQLAWLFAWLLIISTIVPVLNISHTRAANGFIDPNGDGAVGTWTTTGTNRYTEIDEATRQPTVPTTTDFITASANSGSSYNARMSTIGSVTTVSQVQVWIYHNDGANGQIAVQLYDDNETTTRSTAANLTQSTTNAWHSVTFTGLNLTQAQLNTLTVRLTANKNGGGPAATITVYAMYADVTYSTVPTTYEQSGYRFFNSQNSSNVGTPLAAQNAGVVLGAAGANFRLRILVHVGGNNIAINSLTIKLQYVDPGSGTCASPSGGTPASYTDVTGATLIAYRNTPSVSDGATLTTNANDPTHSGHTIVGQTYEEANNQSNSVAAINAGQDGMWDYSLQDNGAPTSTTYCLRIVNSSGSVLDTYSQYPQVTTAGGVLSVDIVDGSNVTVTSPSVTMSSTSFGFDCQTTTGTLGTSTQKVRIDNYSANPAWNVAIAATAGSTASWSSGANNYDYNDSSGTPAGCADGGDGDSYRGQLTLDPSVSTSSPQGGCTNTGISLGSSSAYVEGSIAAITLISASSSASSGCTWDVTGIGASQKIPPEQPSGNYQINLTITATAV